MYVDINKYLLIFIGWVIQISYQLDCLQCTSPIRRVSQSWDHSCLEGTLMPLPCHKTINISEPNYTQCVSALYRVGQRGIAGVLIYRACTTSPVIQHECDPPASFIDFERTENFYCSHTCSDDGCNRHLVEDITSNTTKLFKNSFFLLLLYFIYFLFRFDFGCNLFT